MPTLDLTKSTTYAKSALPSFWKQALIDFRDAPITKTIPNHFTSADEAKAVPLWCNPFFTFTNRAFVQSWRAKLGMVRVRDTLSPSDNCHYDDTEMLERITDTFRKAGAYAVYASAGKIITLKSLLKQWNSMMSRIPSSLFSYARGITTPSYVPYGMGAVLLRRMGWKEGTSLGKQPGITEPIEAPTGTKGRAGLGNAPRLTPKAKRAARKTKYKVTRWEGELLYGTYNPLTSTFSIHTLATNGTPHFSHRTITVDPRYVYDVCWWGKGIAGPAVLTYPHPQGWTLSGPDVTLDKATVKALTLAYILPKQVTPSCIAYWTKRFGYIDWDKVGIRYREKLLTPKDFMSHFKNILHRALFTRHKNKDHQATGAILCRLCHQDVERIAHLSHCRCLRPLWDKFHKLHDIDLHSTTEYSKLTLLGVGVSDLPPAVSDFHLILWKFIIIHFTLVDLDNRPFQHTDVWKGAVRRYISKANSLSQQVRHESMAAEARNRPPKLDKFNKILHPLATIDFRGDIHWKAKFAPHAAEIHSGGGSPLMAP